MIALLIKIYTATFAKLKMPYNHKRFKLCDYFKIEKELDKLDIPFAIGISTTYGNGSNMGIKINNLFSKDKRKRKSKKTHVFIFINQRDGYKFRVAEQIGSGLHEISLLEAIGQQDELMIRVPNKKFLPDNVSSVALEYIHKLLDRDALENKEYDNTHLLDMDDSSDCSGLLWQALTYAFSELELENLLRTVERGGMETYTPVDVEFSRLFNTIYDDGFIKCQ